MKKINLEPLFEYLAKLTDQQRFFLMYLFEYTNVRLEINSTRSYSQTKIQDFFPTLIITFQGQEITPNNRLFLNSFPPGCGLFIDYGTDNGFVYIKLSSPLYVVLRAVWLDVCRGRYKFVKIYWAGRCRDTMPDCKVRRVWCPSWAEYPSQIDVRLSSPSVPKKSFSRSALA